MVTELGQLCLPQIRNGVFGMTKKTVLGMPRTVFYVVCSVLVIGIIIGSFYDYQISVALSNTTGIGDFYQHYGNIISHLLYVIAGVCLFKGLKKKGERFNTLAWGVLGFSLFWTFYSFLDTSGKYLREVYGYEPGQAGSFLPLTLSMLTWIALACLTAWLANLILDDEKADLLLAIGSVILIGGIFSEFINAELKDFAGRPRYKYLLTLDDPTSEYRNWWEMTPYLKDESAFRSWPSGHMTKATIMLTLPMLADVVKRRKAYLRNLLFAFAVVWIVVLGYNRIHMNAHFLTDVCFGVLITYCLYALAYKFAFSVFDEVPSKDK